MGYGTPCDAAPSDLRPPPRTDSTGVWWLRGFGAVCRPLSPSSLPRGPQGWHTGDSGLRWLWGAVALGCGGFGVRWLWVLTGGDGDAVLRELPRGHGCPQELCAPDPGMETCLSSGLTAPWHCRCPGSSDGDTSVPEAVSHRTWQQGHVCPWHGATRDSRGDAARPPQPLGAVGTRRWGHTRPRRVSPSPRGVSSSLWLSLRPPGCPPPQQGPPREGTASSATSAPCCPWTGIRPTL